MDSAFDDLIREIDETQKRDRMARRINSAPTPPHGYRWQIDKRPLADFSFVALDIEATGDMHHLDRPIEVGAVRFSIDGAEEAVFDALMNPDRPISPAAIAVHGITDAMVATASPLRAVLPNLIDFLDKPDTVVVAHNASYDRNLLGFAFYRNRLRFLDCPWLCTCSYARKRVNHMTVSNGYGLETLCQVLGLAERQRHRALPDARLAKELFLLLVGNRPSGAIYPYPPKTIGDLFRDKKPRFLASLPISRQIPYKFKDLKPAMENRSAISLRLKGEESTIDRTFTVTPLWFSANEDLLVVDFEGTEFMLAVHKIEAFALDR